MPSVEELERRMHEGNRELHPTLIVPDYGTTHKCRSNAWESGPMKLLSFSSSYGGTTARDPQAETRIIAAYNCLIHALKSIYNQAPHTPTTEYKSFIWHSLATYQCSVAQLGTLASEVERIE